MDMKAFDCMSYGLYVISTKSGGHTAACVVNTLTQATVTPVRVTVTVNKENETAKQIEKSGLFTAVALSQEASMELIGDFGFRCSRDLDKFARWNHTEDENGVPYLTEQAVSRYSCKVVGKMDAGTHTVFLGEVVEAECLGADEPMTYAYYHKVKRGLTPPKASSYRPEAVKGYRCRICGYVLEADAIPDDFVCPICGQGKEQLEPIPAE